MLLTGSYWICGTEKPSQVYIINQESFVKGCLCSFSFKTVMFYKRKYPQDLCSLVQSHKYDNAVMFSITTFKLHRHKQCCRRVAVLCFNDHLLSDLFSLLLLLRESQSNSHCQITDLSLGSFLIMGALSLFFFYFSLSAAQMNSVLYTKKFFRWT